MGTGQAPAEGAAAELDEIGRGVVAAARDEFVRFGIRRANVEEIARRAGVARVTVYRRFESKTALLQAVVMADIMSFVARFDAVLAGDAPIEDRIADALALAVAEARGNALLGTVVQADPEAVTAALTLQGQAPFEMLKALLTTRVAGLLDREGLSSDHAPTAAEAVLRIMYSIILLPFGDIPGRTSADVRAFAREFIVPLVVRANG